MAGARLRASGSGWRHVHNHIDIDTAPAAEYVGSTVLRSSTVRSDAALDVATTASRHLTAVSTTQTPAPTFRIQRPAARFFKRTFDLLVSVPVAALALLILPFLAIAVRLDSRGPVFFRHERIGRGGKRIAVLKIRSMYIDAEERLHADPELYKMFVDNNYKLPKGCDPRITRVGRVLRTSSLDELPQVFSILTGSMSVVGPRPVVPGEDIMLYGDRVTMYHLAKPGLTGLWQVSGRSELMGEHRAELDLDYIENWSLLLDVRLLLRTIPAVISARGAH